MIDLVLVSYLNTIPFLRGLESSQNEGLFRIHKKMPADCATMFIKGDADIALLPVGALPILPNHQIITDFCIGCEGPVRTVVLFANCNIKDIETVHLDTDSKTSYTLVKVLLDNFYGVNVQYKNGVPSDPLSIGPNESILMIGDKVFENESSFTFTYDLGAVWEEFTSLPFTFAVWVAKPEVTKDTIQTLNDMLTKGVNSINTNQVGYQNGVNLDEYLTKNISYTFNNDKKQAVKKYLKLGSKYILDYEKVT